MGERGIQHSPVNVYSTRLGADCGSDRELFIAKFRLKLKKVGKTTRPFKYDLNQIPYDYTMEVTNRFKGLDLKHRVPEELSTEVHDTVQETGIKTIPMEKKCKKAKWPSEEALQIAVKRKGKIYPFDGEGNGTTLQYSCLENPMDRRAWWAAVHEVARVGHD